MKRKIILSIIICLCILLVGCENDNKKIVSDNLQIGKASNLLNVKDWNDVVSILKSAELDNIDVFKSWVKDFNKGECTNCGLLKEWTDYKKIAYDEISLSNHWEELHEESDADCRMTSFLLIMNHLSLSKTINENGSYLMFDVDAIDNVLKYSMLKNNKEKFITIFNEIDINGITENEIKNAYNKKWKEYGIKLNNDKVSLINVVMHDNYGNVIFVGHSGLLIDLDSKILFIEKIAFEQPYQVTILKSREELKNMLFSRKTYFGDLTEQGPFIYENEKLLYEYGK